MQDYKFQKELVQTIAWQILPSAAILARDTILENKKKGLAISDLFEDRQTPSFLSYRVIRNEQGELEMLPSPSVSALAEGGEEDGEGTEQKTSLLKDEYVNVIYVDGPITRNGGACSLGSIDIRVELVSKSQDANCIGHVFILNSPGGAASSAYDFEIGVNAAKEAGQPCIGLIDGICASACTRLSAKLDEVYYVHPNMEIGCIGTMAMYYTSKDGDEDEITHQKYHEVYADASTNKNGEFRASASGDDSQVKAILNAENEKFLAEMRELRPMVTDDILSGLMFKCKDMENILVNGQSTFEGCVQRVHDLHSAQTNSQINNGNVVGGKPVSNNNQNNNAKMDMKFKNLQALIGEQENVTEDGFYLNATFAEQIDNALADSKAKIDSSQAMVDELNGKLAKQKAELLDNEKKIKELTEDLATSETKVTDLTSQNEKLVADHKAELDNLTTTHDKEVASLNETISEKDKEIEELSHAQTSAQTPAPATAQEGEGDGTKVEQKYANISEQGLTRSEMIEAFKRRSEILESAR